MKKDLERERIFDDVHTLFVTVMSGVNVFVKELDGTQHTIHIQLSHCVAALKAQMGKLKGCRADAIKLLCTGQVAGSRLCQP